MKTLQLSLDEIRQLAAQERKMDSGEQPFVLWGGHRMAVMPEVAEHLGIVSGQTVSDELVRAITEAHIMRCRQLAECEECGD